MLEIVIIIVLVALLLGIFSSKKSLSKRNHSFHDSSNGAGPGFPFFVGSDGGNDGGSDGGGGGDGGGGA
ncbi:MULTISPECIES: hypothetical protein [Bacillus]|uniref:Methanol dehydrogenase n=2 Tax=Bacillus TaxID=1386 RepID=A0A0M4FXA1_9BACI|nr:MULTISPECIES: hypothetical protein [Bacillus]ALC83543.1 hypothetical protein AM592_19905 [Bacillus gobiensis]MBP1082526.1 hypothetical protein [Bacillus capparidis]MED1097241.1 hypothetical protein [Bacillus capparidis]